jgi:hypothetical protein
MRRPLGSDNLLPLRTVKKEFKDLVLEFSDAAANELAEVIGERLGMVPVVHLCCPSSPARPAVFILVGAGRADEVPTRRPMMAVFFHGMTCPLCGLPVGSLSEAAMFSPFVADRSDPLFLFSDCVVHASCLSRHPLSVEATRWHDEAVRHRKVSDQVCSACGRPVLDPDDYFATGLLARAADNPLFEFNFLYFHRSHADSWPRFDEFRRLMEAAQAEGGQWRGPTLVFGTTPPRTLRWVVRE